MNISLRNILAREMLGNTLVHREFTSTYAAKFVVEKNRMYVENASRAMREGPITPENLEPNPKNPIIASFFRSIGRADRLGSGVRNLFKYSKYYSGKEPQFIEGDVFRIIVPLDDNFYFNDWQSIQMNRPEYSNHSEADKPKMSIQSEKVSADKMPINADKMPINADKMPINADKMPTSAAQAPNENITPQQWIILEYVLRNTEITSRRASEVLGIKQRRARDILADLVDRGILKRQGNYKSTVYLLENDVGESWGTIFKRQV